MKQYIALTGKMKFNTALHIGSGKAGETTDAPLRRDARGRVVLPGTAIAGALRAIATRLAPRIDFQNGRRMICLALREKNNADESCHCQVCHVFGDLNPGVNEEGITDKAKLTHASRLWVYDATLSAEQAGALVRDGVGIDRQTGASASAGAAKFDLEVLPAGTSFELRLELQSPLNEDEWLLAATLAEWQAGRGRLGGRTARGLGSFKLIELQCQTLDLSTEKDLMTFLQSDQPWQSGHLEADWMENNLRAAIKQVKVKAEDEDSAVVQRWVTVSFDLQFKGPFLIHDATLAGLIGYAHAPLLEKLPPPNRDDKWRAQPVLSGAGLRGVLRSHAERIARTLATYAAWEKEKEAGKREAVFRAICPACNPVQSKDDRDHPLTNCDTLLKRTDAATNKVSLSTHEEATDKHLCLACWLFGSTRRGSRLAIQDARMIWESEKERLPYKPQDFLAIDRFTGGGLEGAKFDALGLFAPRFRICMHLENPADWELGWLTLVLRDLRDELVTFGFGAAKGYGLAKAEEFKVKLGFITPEDVPVKEEKLRDKLLANAPLAEKSIFRILELSQDDYESYKDILQEWVGKFNEQVTLFNRENMELPSPASDTYFTGQLPKLYPLDPLSVKEEAAA